MIPTTRREQRTFQALALTAGFCEELAYRGFVLWYLGAYLPVPAAVAAMAAAFGLSHLYQGPKAAAQIALVGVAAALLYLLSGSLWIPMLLHALLDLSQLALVREVLGGEPPAGAELSAPPPPSARS